MKNFPGQGKVRKVWFVREIGKKKMEKVGGKVMEFQNFVKTEMSVAVFNFQKLINLQNIVFIVLLNDIQSIEILKISIEIEVEGVKYSDNEILDFSIGFQH